MIKKSAMAHRNRAAFGKRQEFIHCHEIELSIMNYIQKACLFGAVFLIYGCKPSDDVKRAQQKAEEQRIEELASQKAEEELARRQALEERTAIEATKLAEERERQAALAQEQRERVAADFEARSEQNAAREAAKMQAAAAEQLRRAQVIQDIKNFVDSLSIVYTQIGDETSVRINGEIVRGKCIFITRRGSSVNYEGVDGDYFKFDYTEPTFALYLKRTLRGISIPTVQITETPDSVPTTSTEPPTTDSTAPLPSIDQQAPVPWTGLLILKATFGAENVERDVKALVKQKLKNGRIDFNASSNELGGDPIFGKTKTLYIKYLFGGRLTEKKFRENEKVSLP